MVYGNLFSSILKSLSRTHGTKLSHDTYTLALIQFPVNSSIHLNSFSTGSNSFMRGGNRENRSKDHFPSESNIDNDIGNQNMGNTPKRASDQYVRRPMRERGNDQSGGFSPRKFDVDGRADYREKARNAYQTTQMPKERIRGDKESIGSIDLDDLFPRKVRLGDDGGDQNIAKPMQNQQIRFPDRTIREENRDSQSGNLSFNQSGNNTDVARDKGAETSQQNPSVQIPKTEVAASDSSPQDADEIFRKMKETGLIPNTVAMLDGLCKDGLIQEAMKLFGLIREKGTIPEVVIYTAVVEGFCKAAKFDDAKRIFRKMQNNGIAPNAFSYTILIQGLCKGKKLEDSISFCFEMLEAGHSPNVATFVILMDGFVREKGVEEARTFLMTLREKGFAIDERAVREYLDKKGPFSPSVWEAVFGKKYSQKFI